MKINLEEYVRTLILASGLGEVRLVGQKPEVSLILQNHEVEIEWATLSGGDGYVPEFENQPALLLFLPFKYFNSAEEITINHLQFWATLFPDFGGIFVREGKNTGIEAIIKYGVSWLNRSASPHKFPTIALSEDWSNSLSSDRNISG